MGSIYPSTNIVAWTNAINQSLTNQWLAVTNLYFAKGVRTLLMPNAVDITEVPAYNNSSNKGFIRQRIIDFNVAFTSMLSNAMASCPGLTIYEPDFFSFLDNVLTNAAAYGVTNVLYQGRSIAALDDSSPPNNTINGPGTNYIFWDATDPTAKVHAIMAGDCATTHRPAPNQPNHIAERNQPVEPDQCSGRLKRSRAGQYQSGADELDHGREYQQHQFRPTGFCPHFRSDVVLPGEFSVQLDLAVIPKCKRQNEE